MIFPGCPLLPAPATLLSSHLALSKGLFFLTQRLLPLLAELS